MSKTVKKFTDAQLRIKRINKLRELLAMYQRTYAHYCYALNCDHQVQNNQTCLLDLVRVIFE